MLPPITVMVMTEDLQEYYYKCHQWFYQTKLQRCLFAEPQKSDGVSFTYAYREGDN